MGKDQGASTTGTNSLMSSHRKAADLRISVHSGSWQERTCQDWASGPSKIPRAHTPALLHMKSGVPGSEWELSGEEGVKWESKRVLEKPDKEAGKGKLVHFMPGSGSRCGPVSLCSCCL